MIALQIYLKEIETCPVNKYSGINELLNFPFLVPILVFSDEEIGKGIYGTKRHYWVKPRYKDR